MFAQHEQILRDVFTRVAADSAGLTRRLAVLERGHAEAAQVIMTVVTGLDETRAGFANADTALRRELVEFSEKLKLSEDYVKVQVEGAVTTLDAKLVQLEAKVLSDKASSSGTAAATFPDNVNNVGVAQAYEIKALATGLQELGAGTASSLASVQNHLESLAPRTCHCPDVDTLTTDMVTAGDASRQAFGRISEM